MKKLISLYKFFNKILKFIFNKDEKIFDENLPKIQRYISVKYGVIGLGIIEEEIDILDAGALATMTLNGAPPNMVLNITPHGPFLTSKEYEQFCKAKLVADEEISIARKRRDENIKEQNRERNKKVEIKSLRR